MTAGKTVRHGNGKTVAGTAKMTKTATKTVIRWPKRPLGRLTATESAKWWRETWFKAVVATESANRWRKTGFRTAAATKRPLRWPSRHFQPLSATKTENQWRKQRKRRKRPRNRTIGGERRDSRRPKGIRKAAATKANFC